MPKCTLKIFLFFIIITALSTVYTSISAQETEQDTTITSVDADLINIFTQKRPQKYTVAGITVTGNKYFDETLLISIANINVGDEIIIPGGDNFAKAIQKLWGQNYFSDVAIFITKLEEKNIWIEINVTERPRLARFDFIGVKKSEKEDLTGKTGLVPNRIVTENMKRTAEEAIKKFYAEKSYKNITVKIEEKRDSTIEDAIVLLFYINKGNKVKVNNIDFAGITLDPLKLKKQFKDTKEMSRFTLKKSDDKSAFSESSSYSFKDYLHENGFLTFSKTKKLLDPYIRLKFFNSAKFNQKKFDDDVEKLLEYYNSKGYRDAVIDKENVKILPNAKGNLNISIKVHEGKKYHFGNIAWRGNTKYTDSILTAILGIKKGDIYNLETLNKGIGKQLSQEGGDISALYMDDGYLFFRAEAVETAVYNDTIDFEIRIIEGPEATIKHINITGNERTKEHVIRRELRTLPGEKFRRSDLIRSQREIAQLNFFNQEKIGINPRPNPEDGTVDIDYSVEEKSSDQLELSAGWGGGIGLTGTVGVSFNNFSIKNIFKKEAWTPLPMGDGQKLSLRVQSNGRAFRSYNFSFTEPWLGGKKRNAFTVSLYDTKFANAYDPLTGTYTSSAANQSYIKTSGISVSLAKQLQWPDDYFSLSVGLSYSRYTLKNYYIDQVNLPGFNNGYSNNLSIKLALQRSSIDNPLFPRQGSNFMASLQITPPYSLIDKSIITSANPYQWVEYHKWRVNTEWYVPLGKPSGPEKNKQFVLKAAAKFGFIGKYNNKLNVSPFERFQLGDAGLTNQFALLGYDIIAHRGYPVYQTSNPKINPDQQGASEYFTIFNKYTLELRYPLSLNPSSTIYALGFFEAANGWFSMKDYNPFQLRRSVGIGMRFFLPMFGLLGFDYGIGLDRITPDGKLKDAARFTFMLGFEPE
ncbi:MAG: BamA/TamA family outer membrane protein [Chitinophagaceae bacterium]|nr:BamA/TamA family outer membrane protein [Chitinophagaceae bacterium]MCW5904016.1 BamA/TamA family outer membrane protein [Chitinophagaceae bacterium]